MSNDCAAWDREAATFDDEPDHGLADPATREAWRTLLCSVLPLTPARMVDLGCGTGTLSVLLAEEGYAVHGVDFAPAMVERGRCKADAAGVPVTFAMADVADPALERSAYDVVLCRHVLWAMPDPVAALTTWLGLLAPGGRVVLVEGSWHTGGGITATRCREIVQAAGRDAHVRPLPEAIYWGAAITDERYLVVVR